MAILMMQIHPVSIYVHLRSSMYLGMQNKPPQ